MDWLDGLDGEWLWLTLGVLLAAAELIAPGYFLIWMAVAAFATGLVTVAAGVDPVIQVLCFVVFSLFSVLAARSWLLRYPIESSDPLMNDRGGRLVGQTAVVTQAIEGGGGRVRHGDSEWIAHGPDSPVGARLTITGHEGTVLLVAPMRATHIEEQMTPRDPGILP